MLQQMRGLAKYIWVIVALVFVGGFLLYETSGLIGQAPITPTTAVAVVNGHEIPYNVYLQRVENQVQSAQQQAQGRALSEDDNRQIQNNVFDQMVLEILLSDQYRRRGIGVSDEEIQQFARVAPPNWIMSAPELQTNGQFDPEKYQRFLGSAQARESGLLLTLEQYYRTEIPREKLFDQISSGIYVSDAELWRSWRDQHDSAQVSFVAFAPAKDTAAARAISDAELRAYFDKHRAEFERTGQANLTVVMIPKTISAADTAAARARTTALRNEIVGGAKFEDVAKRESSDSASGQQGGDLGKGGRGRFVAEFENAAYALRVGQLSQPVLTPFGFHLIRVDSRKGDTLSVRHILVPIQATDSESTKIDREADRLASLAANNEDGSKLDSAAAALHLPVRQVTAYENQVATAGGQMIPSVSAWAFGGAHPGETSDLYDDERGYYLARLDSLRPGGEPDFDSVKEDVRARVALQQQIDKLKPEAQRLATAAAGSSLEAAAQQAGKTVEHTPMFSRSSFVPGLGQFSEPIGAAFALRVGAVSQPVSSDSGVFVLRVDKRVVADSTAWAAQKQAQRSLRLRQLRQQKIQMFLQDIRTAAKIEDRRDAINAATRRAQT